MKQYLLMSGLLSLIMASGCSSTSKKSAGYSGYGLDSLSKDTLAKYAPPPPQAEIKNKIEKLVDIRATSAGIVTNNGKELFTGWDVTGSNQIWKLRGPQAFPLQLTGGEDRSLLSGLSPDNRWLAIARDSKGDENHGIYLMSAEGGELKKVYYNPKHQTSFLGFTQDSKNLYYRTNDKSPSSYSIYKYNIATDHHEVIWDKPGIWTLSDVENDKAILTQFTGSMQNEHSLLDLKTKKTEPLLGQNEKEDFEVAFTAKPGEYLVLTNKLSDFRQIYLLKDKKLTPYINAKEADIRGLMLSRNRRILVYSVNNKGYSQLHLVDLPSKKERHLPSFGTVEQVQAGSISPNNRYLTMATELYNAPRKNYVLDLNSMSLTQWVTPSTPEMNPKNSVRPELLSYKAADGTEIPMFVWRSERCKKEVCPVVISFHGGPESQFVPRFNPIYNFYTERGFVYVAPNVRGSDGYGKKWLHADDRAGRLNVITDIRDCAESIKKTWRQGDKVPKVGITGGSYGGYSTLVGMSMFADSYDAGLAIVGMSSLITFIENTAPYRRDLRMNEYGNPQTERDVMLKLSPVSYIDKVTKPLMIAHGATDPRVPVGEAVQFFETVQKQNNEDRLVIFPDEGHGVSKRPNIVLLHSYAIDFFEKHLK